MISTATRTMRREGFTPAQRDTILDGCCHYCGTAFPSEVDHVIPWSRGGSDDLENLVAACYRCNRDKSDLTPEEWAAARAARGAAWPLPTREAILLDLTAGLVDDADAVHAAVSDETLLDSLVSYVDQVHRHGEDRDRHAAMLAMIHAAGGASA